MGAPFVSSRWLVLPTWVGLAALLLTTSSVARAQELPKKDGRPEIDVEPKLMLNDLPDIPLPAPYTNAPAPAAPPMDVLKVQAELEKAKSMAVRRERLWKEGVLSKVEAEQAALKIVRLTRDLETARMQAAERAVEEQRQLAEKEASAKAALSEAEAALAAAKATAEEAAAKWTAAQRGAAELRVQRERRLLAAGAGSRVSVKRAEAALQLLAPVTP